MFLATPVKLILLFTFVFSLSSFFACGDSSPDIEHHQKFPFSGAQKDFTDEEFSFIIDTKAPRVSMLVLWLGIYRIG